MTRKHRLTSPLIFNIQDGQSLDIAQLASIDNDACIIFRTVFY